MFVLLAPPMRSLVGLVAAAAASPCANDDGRLGVDVATALPDVDDGFMSQTERSRVCAYGVGDCVCVCCGVRRRSIVAAKLILISHHTHQTRTPIVDAGFDV